MPLQTDLTNEVTAIFKYQWTEEKALVVPDAPALRLNTNHAKELEAATVLYADLQDSTNMVDQYVWWFAAEVYRAYLRCASQIIKAEGGVISAYDGDRVMAIFTGNSKNTSAVRAALKINFAVNAIIRPAIALQYKTTNFLLQHVVGVDTSGLRVARIGVHGDNDLVWIGRAANHAAKLCALQGKPIWITKTIYDEMNDSVKLSMAAVNMWELWTWYAMNNRPIYCTTFQWAAL
jgi:uridylate cyclase